MKKLFYLTVGAVLGAALAGVTHTKAEQPKEIHILNDLEYANYRTLGYKIEIIEAYNVYYKEVETLLDTISIHYNWYDDEPMGYYLARERVDSLWSLEDDDDPIINK